VAPVVFDPNIRPAVMGKRDLYVAAVEKWVAISACVKVSDDDLYWLYPDEKIESVVNRWLSDGVALVVVTYGAKGITGYTSSEVVAVDAVKVEVVDTVGAGDTVGAVLVEAIVEKGLSNLTGDLLRNALARAAGAAAITCSRTGARPPSRMELA
jgi:fructokinase